MSWLNEYRKWLSESESLKNAQLVVNHLYTNKKDWAKESICALLGNMRIESSVNPNMYEYGFDWGADRGFGLVQWTPRSKYWNWALQNGYKESELRNGNAQLDRIDYEVKENIQWIPKQSVFNGLTFKEFRTNSKKLTIAELTEAFMWGYERPNEQAGLKSLPERIAFAKKCEKELKWSGGGGGGGGGEKPPEEKPPEEKPPEEKPDFSSITNFFNDFTDNLFKKVNEILTIDLYNYSNHAYSFGNTYIKMIRQLDNMYKIKPTLSFDNTFKEITKKAKEELDKVIKNLGNDSGEKPPEEKPPEEKPPEEKPSDKPILPMTKDNLYVTSEYGMRNGRMHWGIDLGKGGNPLGQKVMAVMSGEVVEAKDGCHSTSSFGCNGGAGNYVTIKHNGDKYYTRYLHLGKGLDVKVGDKVTQGQKIGTMANSGSSYGVHLHFEVSPKFPVHGNQINPREYIKDFANVPKT